MTADERRAYSRGYAAGRRSNKAGRTLAQLQHERQAFRERAFLAALPFAMAAQGWLRGDEPIRSVADRVRLAVEIADEATRKMR